ncbi:hypothetical protein AAFF_G00251140 [Aldrovandia affinis]|uniref:PiggyBac transposable element-derived protein domain-containing protein n=1 Tax=Aldrovandia affinis TaxID=143900 RepID=A0AAD7W318_9TELE|nr:hypothetical protein AAFF_G00251140 [Aldrovandia affinis]
MARFSAFECLRAMMESDEDNSSSCPDSEEDSDEERQHFQFRIDPAEDLTDEDDDDVEDKARTPPPKKPCRTPTQSDDDVEDKTHPPPPKKPRRTPTQSSYSGTRAPLQVATEKPSRIHSPASQASRHPPWKTETAPDEAPPVSRFQPARPPGVQLNLADNHTPLDLFKQYVTRDAVNTLCRNTNKQAAMAQAKGSKYTWTDVGVEEFYKYIGLLFYMAMVKLHDIRDYWRQNTIYSLAFPVTIMTRDRYRAISWNVHMSDPDKDQENDRKRGTPQYDKLFRLRPFMDTIQHAIHYNKHMGGVDLSDQLIQYYTVQHKTSKWYRKLFLHFLDIAAINAYHLHTELSSLGQREAMTHKAFQEELIAQLCGVSQKVPRQQATFYHVPVPTGKQTVDVGKQATVGRKKCTL